MSSNKNKNATSLIHRLQNLASSTGISVQNVRTDFLLERLIARLTVPKELANNLVFKGGIVSSKVFGTGRYTQDIDLAPSGDAPDNFIDSVMAAVDLKNPAPFIFESPSLQAARNGTPDSPNIR